MTETRRSREHEGASVLQLRGVRKQFGSTEIIRGVDLDFRAAEKHAIIGPNGAGKSTLFNLISGRTTPSSGSIRLNGRNIGGLKPHRIAKLGLSRSFQITNVFGGLTIFENIRCAVLAQQKYMYSIVRPLEKIAEIEERTVEIAQKIGLLHSLNRPANELGYADMRALELGLTLAGNAHVLLLDEPMAGMNRSETRRALDLIQSVSVGRTVVVVEHDMEVVFEFADRISVLVYGEVIATGTPQQVRENQRVRDAYLGATNQ